MVKTQSEAPESGGQNPTAEILTDEAAANYIGAIEARTVRDWRMKRGLPYVKLTPKVIRIRKQDLDKWLAQHRVATVKGAATP